MNRFVPIAVLVIFTAAPLAVRAQTVAESPPTSLGALSDAFEALAARVTPSVVQIFVRGYVPVAGDAGLLAQRSTSGSGVILDGDGYVVTNAHVVAGARTIQVQLASEHRSPEARSIVKPRGKVVGAQLVGLDRETDLAVLKIEARDLPALPLGNSDALAQGQIVFAFGSPFGLDNSMSMGIVSALARQPEPDHPMIYLQTDAPINPGNSGGPLVDEGGRVVGINTFILSQSGGNEGLGFAAPSNIVKNIYEQLRATGQVRRGHIGVHVQSVTPALASGLKLARDWGVVVSDIAADGPAAKTALRPGDLVLALDGKPMENARQFDVNLYRHRIGETVQVEVQRGDRTLTVPVTVAERRDDPGRFMDLVSPERNLVPQLGILAIEMTPAVAAMLPGVRQKSGVVVAASTGGGLVEQERFLPGDVIRTLNGTEIRDVNGLRAAAAALRPGAIAVAHVERGGALVYVAFEVE